MPVARIPTDKHKIAELRRAGKSQAYIDSYMRRWREVGELYRKRSATKESA